MVATQIPPLAVQNATNSVQNTLRFENDAVSNLSSQYQNDEYSISNIIQSIFIMYNSVVANNGKIVITGVGKSYKLGLKLVATLNSLSIHASGLHPTDALHGDLGMINQEKDCLIMVTASGNTPELMELLPHFSTSLPIILLTCSRKSKLSEHSQITSLILAELLACHKEELIHGIPAPTVSFTLSLVLADAVILALLELIESDVAKRKKLFGCKHPGGSIGANLNNLATSATNNTTTTTATVSTNSSMLSLNLAMSSTSSYTSSEAREESIKDITYKDLLMLQELPLLQWIVKYDTIKLIEHDGKVSFLSCEFIQNLYKRYDGSNWDKFKWELIRKFT
jgi:D-arabinose 5-phosphate isomerase GutQ